MQDIKSKQDLSLIQLEGLKWTVKHAYENSPFYKRHFDRAGIKPSDIKTLDDLARLPFTEADHLKENYPFPLLSVPVDQVVRIHSSSGTTGTVSYTHLTLPTKA